MTKLYTPQTWIDEVLSGAERYDILTGAGVPINSDVQLNLATGVTVAGSPVNAARLNHMETGIDVIDTLLASFDNYQIVVSASSGTITFSIKDLSGNNHSATNQGRFKVGNSIYALSSSYSFQVTPGINWCNLGSAELAGMATDLFVYAIAETGATAGLKFGFSRIPYARTMGEFINTFTSEKYLVSDVGTRNATDIVQVIGRFRAQVSAAASYNWSIAAQVVVNRSIYETDWLDWTPVHTRTGGAYTNAPVVGMARYYLRGRSCFYEEYHTQHATTPGSSGNQKMTLPFTINQRSSGIASNLITVVLQWLFQENTLNYAIHYKADGTAEATAGAIYSFCGNFSY